MTFNCLVQDCSKWILCRVYQREGSCSRSSNHSDDDDGTELSCLDEMFLSMDDLDDRSCIQNVGNTTDDDDGTELSCLDEMFLSMDDDLDDISFPN
jgi:hypothetical protein